MHIHLIAAVAALAFTGAASAQSHSVSNMANPPQTQSDNKAATEATPGKTATANRNTNKQADKNAGQARNAPTARQAAGKAETSGGSTTGATGATGATSSAMIGDRVGAGSSATATTGIGAGNGDLGAEGAMEIKPSDAYVNPVERRALDEAPKSGKK